MHRDKYGALLDTAERLFYAEGFHATGIDRIIAQAGVARMTLYNHFSSKDELVEAVLARRFRRYLDAMREAPGGRGEGGVVQALVELHASWLATVSTRGCIVLKAIGEYECQVPAIAQLGRQLKQELVEVIEGALAADGYAVDRGLAERILLVFEGADALVPVLGVEPATDHLRALVPAVLASRNGVAS